MVRNGPNGEILLLKDRQKIREYVQERIRKGTLTMFEMALVCAWDGAELELKEAKGTCGWNNDGKGPCPRPRQHDGAHVKPE